MKEIKSFHQVVSEPAKAAEQAEKNNRKTMGYLCSYTPEEIIYAAGFHPMRLFSSRNGIFHAENHLQTYCCSLVRGVLEDSLSGRLDFLHGAVFPHTCDSIQRLSDIWRLNTKYAFFTDLVLPVKLNTKSSYQYMKAVLSGFKKTLEQHIGREISNDDLSRAVFKFNKIRTLIEKVYELKKLHPKIISGKDVHAIVKGSMIMDRDDLPDRLEHILTELENALPSGTSTGPGVVISGSVCDSPDIYDIIEQAGGVVAGDDLCTGQRWFESKVYEDISPLEALTERLTKRMICPAKHHPDHTRCENLVRLVKDSNARGVVFMLLKFCDPHAFDYPYLNEYLEKEGIKSLLLEMDDQSLSAGQLTTRVETFIEML
ncbi:MAG: 2-hydroxyacyl-CoA dehydratase family protein [Thermodesulfobacteriota bacterium]|nr:2-hydroxyacyl-CoA dehydratase family protein [Thermodesulfobacteriota bacterium]